MKHFAFILFFISTLNLNAKNIDSLKTNYSGRYLFAPSAFRIDKGYKSYTNIDLFIQDFQFGITNNLSVSAGTSIILNPVYIIPNYSFRINDKSAFAIGDLFLLTTYDHVEFGNLFYALYSRGNCDNNFTIGAGLWYSKIGEDQTETINPDIDPSFVVYEKEIKTISPAFNFSAQLKLSKHTYFITENYWFKMNMDANADLKGPNPVDGSYEITLQSDHYAIEETVLAGIFGLRLLNKKNHQKSWQISSIYILAHNGEIPEEYKQPGWETYNNEGGYLFFPIPFITYTVKF